MLEITFVVAVVAGAALVVGRLRRNDTTLFEEIDVVDLPCPWCKGQTREDDAACPSCDHPFGVAES